MKIGTFETHPAADLFPMLEGPAFDELVADVKLRGVEHPVVILHEGKRQLILDGRNRFKASIAAKVKCPFTTYRGKDPYGFVVSVNLKRRHLDESQRAMIAGRIARLEVGANQHSRKRGSAHVPTQETAASLLNVGDRTVRAAKVVLERAVPEVVKAVDEGRMKVTAAAELAQRPVDEQRAIAAKVGNGKEIRTGHVRALVRQNQRRETVAKINRDQVPPPPMGPFSVIVTDYPWPYENSDGHGGSRGHTPYPPMTMDDVYAHARANAKLCADDCIQLHWTTNHHIQFMHEVVAAWGAVWVSTITLVKSRTGLGINAPRGRTEHIVLAMRGKPVHTLNEVSTWLGDRTIEMPREHSRKPDEFYEMVEKHCPGAKLEMFAREPREGWARWGAESDKFRKDAA